MIKGLNKRSRPSGHTVREARDYPPHPKLLLRIGCAALALTLAFGAVPYLLGIFGGAKTVVTGNMNAKDDGEVVYSETVTQKDTLAGGSINALSDRSIAENMELSHITIRRL